MKPASSPSAAPVASVLCLLFLLLNSASLSTTAFSSTCTSNGARAANKHILNKNIRPSTTAATATATTPTLTACHAVKLKNNGSAPWSQRRQLLQSMATTVTTAVPVLLMTVAPTAAYADVSDGTALPEAAAQFQRAVRLRSDLPQVKKRLLESNKNDIDKKEWDNIGKFLRTIYSTAENDLQAIANSITTDNTRKEQALQAIRDIRKYAQAGAIPADKQDATGTVAVLDKIIGFVQDFFDALSDVPDEL